VLSIFNLSGGTAQSGRSHCSIQAEPLLNFAGRADFAERCTHLKDVQEWLGHSDIKMTANIYGHLDIRRKRSIANGLEQALPRLKP